MCLFVVCCVFAVAFRTLHVRAAYVAATPPPSLDDIQQLLLLGGVLLLNGTLLLSLFVFLLVFCLLVVLVGKDVSSEEVVECMDVHQEEACRFVLVTAGFGFAAPTDEGGALQLRGNEGKKVGATSAGMYDPAWAIEVWVVVGVKVGFPVY